MITPNVDAERSLLGAVGLRQDAIDDWGITADEFGHPRHQAIARSMLRLRARHEPIDPVTVADDLAAHGFAGIGIGDVSDAMAGTTSDPGVLAAHAALVREVACLREIASEASRIAVAARSGTLSSTEASTELRALAASVDARAGSGDHSIAMPTLARDLWADISDRCDGKRPTGVRTGFDALDSATGGLRPGVLTVLGARTSMGKSALARSIADNVSARGEGVHFFSLEDTALMLAERQMADTARVNLQVLASPADGMTRGQMSGLALARDSLHKRPNWVVNDRAGLSSAQIAASVRKHKAAIDTRLVVVDYITLVKEAGRDKRGQVDAALAGLFEMARNENVAVLVLAQLLRAADNEDRYPRLSDLKESGAIEETASCVLLIHRAEDGPKPFTGVLVAKNKAGARGLLVPLHWDGPTATYRNAVQGGRYE